MKNINQMFAASVLTKSDPRNEIIAIGPQGQQIKFTMSVFEMLKDDPTIVCIISAYTGEILFENPRFIGR